MNMHRKRHPGSMLLIVLVLGALLGACGADKPSGKTVNTVSGGTVVGAPTVGLNTCTSCHAAQTADWMLSKHANVEPQGNLYSQGNPTIVQISGCTKNCHDPLGDSARLVAGYTGNMPRPVVGCESCHGGGSLHVAQGGLGPIGTAAYTAGVISGTTSSVQVSAQFATCTSCHELLSSTDPASAATTTAVHDAGGTDPRVVTQGTNTNINSITDTHFATPNSWLSNNLNTHSSSTDYIAIFGYVMDYADEKVCSNCHNPHQNATINRDWAQSGHADRQGIKIDPKSGAFVGNLTFSSAWAHYNWTKNIACQRCHTTTGFVAYTGALKTGNTAQANAINLGLVATLPTITFWKPEMLMCNGCHTDNRGTLRNPGAITADYSFVTVTTVPPAGITATFSIASHAYPDVAGSNVCMTCHVAREIGDTIKNTNDPALLSAGTITFYNFGTRTLINSHYLTAGATVFGVSGYTFTGRDYSNLDMYMHDKIGTSAAPNTGSNGPCAGCHMSRPNKNGNHLFLPVSRTASGAITGIASEVCFKCHGPNDVLMLDLVQTQKTLYKEAIEALKDALDMRGYYFSDFSPYIYSLRARTSPTTTATVAVTSGSAIVTLNSGTWSTVAGAIYPATAKDRFRVNDDGQFYTVKVGGNNVATITLQAPYTGPTNTNAEYTIIGSSVTNWLTTTTPFYPTETVDTDNMGYTTGKNNMGAAFNFNLLEHDPGSYVHNRYYVKRLIYDSLDWLDDNLMNYSVGATLSAECAGPAPVWCAGAMEYLLPNGILGIAAERP
jgi:hypothetical protein